MRDQSPELDKALGGPHHLCGVSLQSTSPQKPRGLKQRHLSAPGACGSTDGGAHSWVVVWGLSRGAGTGTWSCLGTELVLSPPALSTGSPKAAAAPVVTQGPSPRPQGRRISPLPLAGDVASICAWRCAVKAPGNVTALTAGDGPRGGQRERFPMALPWTPFRAMFSLRVPFRCACTCVRVCVHARAHHVLFG